MYLSMPGSYDVRRNFEAEIYILKTDESGIKGAIKSGYRPVIY
jgi:translation elongation factor EF-Tu-like GTPase